MNLRFSLRFFPSAVMPSSGWSLLICFVPRILVGVFAAWVFLGLSKTKLPQVATLAISGVAGSLTNTLLVLSGIYAFYREPYAAAYGMTVSQLLYRDFGYHFPKWNDRGGAGRRWLRRL